jgi:hypothetical protein
MKEAIQAMAESCERVAAAGLVFHVNAFVYYEDGGFVQVLRHDYEGGAGNWSGVLSEAVSGTLPADRNGALMVRWTIEFAPLHGNHRIGDRSEHDT